MNTITKTTSSSSSVVRRSKKVVNKQQRQRKKPSKQTAAAPAKGKHASPPVSSITAKDGKTKVTMTMDPSIDKEIQMLENEIERMQQQEAEDHEKRAHISRSLIRLIHTEFHHIDWKSTATTTTVPCPPKRVLDWCHPPKQQLQWTPGLDRSNLVAIKKDPIILGRLNASIRAAKTPEQKCAAQLKYCQDVMECYEGVRRSNTTRNRSS